MRSVLKYDIPKMTHW